MKVAFDATPLLGRLTGIGHYVDQLVENLPAAAGQLDVELELVATAFTLRGNGLLEHALTGGVTIKSRGVPARALRASWARTEFPPVEWLCGRADIFHGTNFVLPPVRHAAGVVTVHDLSYLRFPETVSADSLRYQELVPRSIARARVVCTLTAAMRDEIAAEYGLEPDRIHVTYPGVDPAWFDVAPLTADDRRRLGLPSRYLLAVGTLEPRKNLAQLLRAYGRLRASDPQTPPMVLAGASGWGPSLDLDGLPPQAVVKTGYLDTADLRSVVAGASCLAFPSIYEGFGLPPVEALACGVPVVASDLPVTREVLGDAARLVPTGDDDALAEALRIELNAPAPDRATVAARQAQARRWTWSRCAEQTLAAYQAALAE